MNRETEMKSNLFTTEEYSEVNRVVQQAEASTSAEIMPVVAKISGRYDRPEDIVGVWVAGLALIAVWLIYPLPSTEAGGWGNAASIWQLVALLFGASVGFFIGVCIGTRVAWLRRLFTPQKQMTEEVYGKARQVFFDSRVRHTTGGTGVLLYVSLYEHVAAVIADQSVVDKLGQEKIDAVCAEFTHRLHEGTVIRALCETTAALGQILAAELPRAEDDVNELSDALVVLE